MGKEKKPTVPKLRLPGFTKAWKNYTIGDVSKRVIVGLATSVTPYYRDAGIPILRNLNIKENYLDDTDILYLDKSYAESQVSKKIQTGDVLTVRTGYAGISCVVPEKYSGSLTFTTLITTTNQCVLNGDFFAQYLNSEKGMSALQAVTTQGGRSNLNVNDFIKVQIKIPSLQEQEKICKVLKCIDQLNILHQRKLESLQQLKKSLLLKLFPKNGSFEPELRFPGFTGVWKQRKFQEITQRVSTSSISSIDFPSVEYEDIEAGSGTLNKDVKVKDKNKRGIVFDKNDVLFGKLRPYLMNWLLADFKGVAVGDFWVLRSQHFDPKFVYSLIQSKPFQEVANRSSGSKMPRADWNLVSNTLFFVPSQNNEQRKIGEVFSSLDKVITLHQRKLESLKKLKKSLLQQMFV